MIRHTDDGLRYLYNALHYTMGIHTDYDKRYSPNVDIYNAYEQFLFVKKYFGKTSGNPVFHFIVVYNAKSTWGYNDEHTAEMSHRIASYFSDRYQIVYGIHHKPCYNKCGKCTSLYHVHFIMNSVSYIDGKMFSLEIVLKSMLFWNILSVLQATNLGQWNMIPIKKTAITAFPL